MPQAHNIAKIWQRLAPRQLAGWGVVLIILLSAVPRYAHAQNVRFVQYNSTHALSVPENPAYRFEWSMTWGNQARPIIINSKTNVTENIRWDRQNTFYDITVYPVLDSVGCLGEPVQLRVYTVDYLSLHAFNDVYYTRIGESVVGDVSENDFDELGLNLIYNPTLISGPSNGSLNLGLLGTTGEFTYTPDPGFVGVDYFVYEVRTDADPSMFASARVTIVVRDDDAVAELYVEKTGPEKALFGERIVYNIKIINYGPDVAEDVVLTDSIPFGLFTPEYSLGTSILPWKDSIIIGDIDPGDSVTIDIAATISPNAPRGIWNQALAYSPIYDTDYSNNDSIWFTEIADIYVTVPDMMFVPACRPVNFPNIVNANSEIAKFEWIPGIGLSDSTIASPLFIPDEGTWGTVLPYILKITDINGNVAQDTMRVSVANIPVAQVESDTLYKDIGENIYISGSESSGDDINFEWSTEDGHGHIVQGVFTDSIEIDTTGIYFLLVEDSYGCESIDSVVVLLESHPPVTISDTVWIVAGTDSTVNVLDNDYDINGFDLSMTNIITPPKHGTWSWDDTTYSGNITFMPDIDYWLWDSIQYEACNDGYPQQCSTAWLYIKCVRPPLNADVEITKTGDMIDFWRDSIEYDISLFNHGPDTAFVTVYDDLDLSLRNPFFSVDDGRTWNPWRGFYAFPDSLLPEEQVFRLRIRAFILPEADRYITNTAWIETDIIENNFENDTSRWETKIKDKVIARAGPDLIVGQCEEFVDLDGTESEGENISFEWSPPDILIGEDTPTPIFIVTETANYFITLTVTDDDGIQDTDTMFLQVLPPPLAVAGPDKFVRAGEPIALNGSESTGSQLTYLWNTPNGNIISGATEPRCIVDIIGTYILTVTDQAGCTDSDTVEVYWFYHDPFAIPDYYSTEIGRPVSGNVLDNDFEPNGLFELSISEGVYRTANGVNVYINADGSFTYTPPVGFSADIDYFTYQVCNSAVPANCSRGYVEITVNSRIREANLSVTKDALQATALIGFDRGMLYKITVRNFGPDDATGLLITDSLSKYLTNAEFSFDGISFHNKWNGTLTSGSLAVNDSITIYIRATVTNDAPDRIYNAVTVASDIFDPMFDWGDVLNRNVDTCSIAITTDLQAIASLNEELPSDPDHYDKTIGACDDLSFLDGSRSQSLTGFDFFQWEPGEYVTSPSDSITTFRNNVFDTTIVFRYTVGVGDRVSTATVEVTFSPEVIADAGPDRKMNGGNPLTIDGTNSQGAGAIYSWYRGAQLLTDFEGGNPLLPIIYAPGAYRLEVEDMHGCIDADTVIIRENQLFALNDIMIVVEGHTVTGNVATNDYDPNGDSIYYKNIVRMPAHGSLLPNPPNRDGSDPYNPWSDQLSSDGSFIYVPEPGYNGFDYFTYMVCDDNNPDLCIEVTVYLKIIDVDKTNSPPVANHDHLFVNMNDTLYCNILANDFDYDGGLITLDDVLIEGAQHGDLSLNPNGDIRYIPNPGSVGTERFTYRIWDNGNPSEFDTATVTIEIHKIPEENHPPVAVDDAFYLVEKEITGNLLLNDYDPDSSEFYISGFPVIEPQYGHVEIYQDGSFTYTPNGEGFEGTDQFVYRLEELRDTLSSTATVYIISLNEERYFTDVAIAKTGPVDTLSGTRIQWALDISVVGPTLANDIVISDTLLYGLTDGQFSIDEGATWRSWNGEFTDNRFEQMMLYEQRRILIRAQIPEVFSGQLPNTAWVSHDMNETVPENNDSTWITEVYQRVIARPGNDTLIGSCNTEYMLNGTASVGMGDLEFRWSPASRVTNPGNSITEFTVEPGDVREFVLVVSSSYRGYTDSDTASVWIERAEEPVARAGEDQWPEIKVPVLLDGGNSTGAGPLKYSWWINNYEGDKVSISYYDTVTVMKSNDYYLTVFDRFACEATDLMHVAYPIEDFVAYNDCYVVTAQQEPVDIYVLRNDSIDPEDEYVLDLLMVIQQPSNGYIIEHPYDSMFTYVPDDYFVGWDTFTYVASTQGSGEAYAKVCIQVLERRPKVPEGFSPNADGINDFLIIENIEKYEYNKFIVFNRWGNIVYEKEKYSNDEPWDGIANKGVRIGSGPLPAGVYLYVLDLGDKDKLEEDLRILKGNIYIASDTR